MKLNLVFEKIVIKKVIISLIFGLLGFFGSLISISYIQVPFEIHLQWSFIFPLIISFAYGYKYGLLSAILGFGAFFPFLLWPTNGWTNLITIFIYICYFIYFGFFNSLYERTSKLKHHPGIVFIPFIIIASFLTRFSFPIIFKLNPPFWNSLALSSISINILNTIVMKEILLLFTALILTNCLFKTIPLRKLFNLKVYQKQKNNFKIFILSFACGLVVWLAFLLFSKMLLQDYSHISNLITLNNLYKFISLTILFISTTIIACIIMELSERRIESLNELKSKDMQITSISNNLSTSMIYQLLSKNDGSRQFIYVSDNVKSFYGSTPKQIYKKPHLMYSKIHPDDLPIMKNHEKKAVETMSTFTCEVRMLNPDNTYRWSSFTSTPTRLDNKTLKWDGIEHIITKRKEKESYIKYLSYHDRLTDLYNRRFYEEELSSFDTEDNLPLSLIMADINGLKLINDAFGHKSGDEILIAFANIVKKVFNNIGVTARIDGDEFVILLPKTSNLDTQFFINKLLNEISKIESKTTILSVSMGFHTRKNINESISNLFIQAENNMYRTKLVESNKMRNDSIKLILSTLFKRIPEEEQHSKRVSELCESIGIALNLSIEDINELKLAGLYHDIGKIILNKNIFSKPSILTGDEMHEVKRHSEVGYQIIRSISEFAKISEYILYHHERLDGLGYPIGLKAKDIPMQSKILVIADAYDAMLSERPFRKKMSEAYALSEIRNNIGTQFDPKIAKVFVEKVLNKKL